MLEIRERQVQSGPALQVPEHCSLKHMRSLHTPPSLCSSCACAPCLPSSWYTILLQVCSHFYIEASPADTSVFSSDCHVTLSTCGFLPCGVDPSQTLGVVPSLALAQPRHSSLLVAGMMELHRKGPTEHSLRSRCFIFHVRDLPKTVTS